MAGINFDTANTGYGGNYGGGYNYGTNILDLAALGLVFGDGFGKRGYGYEKGGCCAPATCEQVNDCDRDVLKTGFDIQKGEWDISRDVLLGDKCIENKICDSTHKLEKDIWDTDRDVLMGFEKTNHRIDKVECKVEKESAEIKGLIKEQALLGELREEKRENTILARRNEELHDIVLKKDIVAEILAALGAKH